MNNLNKIPAIPKGFVLDDKPEAVPQLPQGFIMDKQPTREELQAEAVRRGLIQAPQPSRDDLLAEAKRRGLEIPEQSLWDKTKAAFKGNAEFNDIGDAASYFRKQQANRNNFKGLSRQEVIQKMKGSFDFERDLKQTGVAVFGNDKDTKNYLIETNPNLRFSLDANGNEIFTDETGESFYINKPGVDTTQVAKAVGQGLTYLQGGAAVAPIKSTALKVAVAGATTGGINAVNQKLAGRENIDGTEVAIAGGLGATAQFISPYIGKVFNWAKNKLTGNVKNIQTGAEIAKANNLNLDKEGLETIGKMRANIDKSVPDEAIIAEYVHGLKLTKGQATQNPQQLADEQLLRNQNGLINKFSKVDDFNNGQIETNLRNIRSNISGGVDDVLEPTVNAEIAKDALVNTARTARDEFKQAYKDVGSLFVKKSSIEGLTGRLKSAVEKSGLSLDKKIAKNANAAIRSIESSIGKMGSNAKAFSLKAFDQERKVLNNLYSPNMNKTDKMALTVIKRELDDWFYNSIDESLYSGSSKELGKLSKARGLMTDYMKRFDNKNGDANKVIRNIIREERTPEEFSNMLVGVNGYSKANAAKMVSAYKNAVGGVDSEGFKALKSHVFEKMILGKGVNQSTGQTNLKGSQGLVSTFNDAFSVKGKTLMKELYTNAEANEIKSLMRSVNLTNLRGSLQNNSGSGLLVTRLASYYGRGLPLIGKFLQGTKNVYQGFKAFKLPETSVDKYTPGLLGVTGGTNNKIQEITKTN